jgi:GNAT superfamily N-acetyltransferase
MNEMVSSAAANAAVDAYHAAVARLTEFMPGAYARQGAGGTWLILTTIPDPELNVVSVGRERDLREVEAFAEEMSATGMPWCVQVRGEADPELKRLAARYGKTAVSTHPLLLWDAGSLPALPAAKPDGTTVRKVPGAESGMFAAALAAGFGLPEAIASLLALPAVLDAPGVTAFMLDLHGEVVATGLNVMVGDYVGMYSGSVPPRYRGNGYYRALVTARLADAVARGARYAVSRNSPMSRPLFEAVGFRLAETWTYLTPAS